MRGLRFWTGMALCMPQALGVRARAPRLHAAPGPTCGTATPEHGAGGAEPLRLLGFGDSIIAGAGAADSGSALVASLARQMARELGRPLAWRALGRSGAGARVLHRQVLAADSGPPADLVVVSAGVNDVTGLLPMRRWRRDLSALALALRAHSPGALVVLVGLPPLDRFPLLPPALARVMGGRARVFDAVLAELAAAEDGWLHLPIGPAVGPELFCDDGFHPGDAGYQVLVSLVGAAVLARWREDPPAAAKEGVAGLIGPWPLGAEGEGSGGPNR